MGAEEEAARVAGDEEEGLGVDSLLTDNPNNSGLGVLGVGEAGGCEIGVGVEVGVEAGEADPKGGVRVAVLFILVAVSSHLLP